MPLSASLEQTELPVDPGGFVRAEIRVRNQGDTPRRARLEVRGPAAEWAWVIPPELDIPAGADVTASLTVRLPRAFEPAPGRHAFELVVAGDGDAERITVPGAIAVAPFGEMALHVEPAATAGHGATRRVTVSNRGNMTVRALLSASGDPGLELDLEPDVVDVGPGDSARAMLQLRAGGRPVLGGRSRSFAVTAVPEGADGAPVTVTSELHQAPLATRRTAGVAAVVMAGVLVAGLVVAGGGGEDPSTLAASNTTATAGGGGPGVGGSRCVVDGHIDPRVTGLERDDIPTLPADFSFFEVAADGCTPVRWNPCEPIHYAINPANAPPTGIADVREAFRRMADVTGMEYVEDPMTDETGEGRRAAYQPERYGQRWAPILVRWASTSRGNDEVQIVGGGFPTRAGDVYVTGNLFLNPFVVTNAQTRTTVAGGFGADEQVVGPVGPEGVTWGRVILHELAHITGLGHTRDPAQLMYPETTEHTTRPVRFETGDLTGLRYLGREAGCLTTPALDTPTRGISGGGGQRAPGQGAQPGLSTP